MRPANFAARGLDRGHDGPYSNENVYEDARSFDHPPLTAPRPPDNDTPPPVPSRTPSTSESTHLTASRTSSGASSSSDVPPPTPPRSPYSLADHSYLELISGRFESLECCATETLIVLLPRVFSCNTTPPQFRSYYLSVSPTSIFHGLITTHFSIFLST